MLEKALFNRVVVCACLGTLSVLTGCERGADGVHAALSARQSGWHRDLENVKAQVAGLRHRFPATATALAPQTLRIRAVLDGADQSVADIDRQATEVAASVDAASLHGASAGEQALEEGSTRMNEYLRALAADVAAAGRQVDEFDTNERASAPASGSLASAH
jgi:hypothetical protein